MRDHGSQWCRLDAALPVIDNDLQSAHDDVDVCHSKFSYALGSVTHDGEHHRPHERAKQKSDP
jgi:hypothetical protein